VHELNAPHISSVDDFAVIEELVGSEPLPDVRCYWGEMHGGDVLPDTVSGFAGDLIVDGSIGSRTAWLEDAYSDAETRGNLYLDADDVAAHVTSCTRRNLQAGFHVIGDAALAEVVTGLRRAADTVGRPALNRCRHRLEHVEMPSADAIAVLAELGVVASVQPAFDAAWGFPGGLYDQRLGQRRETMNPFASFERAGVRLAFGSDSPVTPMAPWGGVRAAVRHSNPDERLDVHSAFAAATSGGHAAAGHTGDGVLSPGKAATYAVWDVTGGLRDGLPDLREDRRLPECVRTVVAGRLIYDAGEGAA
jgi:predicted amidohydrolase YtcJ